MIVHTVCPPETPPGPSAQSVAILAHDLGNLLQAATAALGLARQQAGDAPLLAVAESALCQGATMARALMGCAAASECCALDPAEVIAAMEALLVHAVAPQVHVRLALQPGLGRARVERQSLERAVLNLVLNARDACTAGGNVEIATGVLQRPAGRYLTVTVADDGRGIGPALQARLFEPFFSTKMPGRGSGLGLAQVRQAVARAGGFIELDSAPGAGARFMLAFPLEATPA